jgi:hypothetical protein
MAHTDNRATEMLIQNLILTIRELQELGFTVKFGITGTTKQTKAVLSHLKDSEIERLIRELGW